MTPPDPDPIDDGHDARRTRGSDRDGGTDRDGANHRSFDPYALGTPAASARLVRVPNLFTAPPDVILGAALVAGAGFAVDVAAIAGLAVASILLYAGGTTLNDYADRDVDARERPERPIPAGEIHPSHALGLGGGLLAAGVLVAGVAAGAVGAVVAAVVVGLIGAYDGALKDSPAGFLCMGATRGANVLLGTTAAVVPADVPSLAWSAIAVVALYVAAVTFLGEFETGTAAREPVVVAGAAAAFAAAWAFFLTGLRAPGLLEGAVAVVVIVGFAGWTGRPLLRAFVDPVPDRIGPAVGACVLGLALLDAAFAASTGVGWALAAAAFLVPAVALSGRFDVS